jgi:hypothetical protein
MLGHSIDSTKALLDFPKVPLKTPSFFVKKCRDVKPKRNFVSLIVVKVNLTESNTREETCCDKIL